MALVSILAVAAVFAIGASKKIPIHLGILAIAVAAALSKVSGYDNKEIIALFPTTLFLRLMGTMLVFSVAKINGCFELLARKLTSRLGTKVKLMPFILFFVGILIMSGGGAVYAPMALMVSIGITLAKEVGGNPLLYGIAGAYGTTIGAYLPVGSFCLTVCSTAEAGGITVNPWSVFIAGCVGYLIAVSVVYILLGGYKAESHSDYKASGNLVFTAKHYLTFIAVIAMFVIVMFGSLDLAFVSIICSVILIFIGCANGNEAVKNVSLSTIMMVCGMSMLITFCQHAGGFELVSNALSSIINKYTAGPVMSLLASIMSLFTVASLAAQAVIPMIPGVVANVADVNAAGTVLAAAVGAAATCIGPLSLGGAFISTSIGQTFGEDMAAGLFSKQMGIAIIEMFVLAIVALTGIFNLIV